MRRYRAAALPAARILILIVAIAAIAAAGCIQKEKDVFWVSDNFQDDTPIKTVLANFRTYLNKRELGSLMNCFDESFNIPDPINNAMNVTYRTLLYDYKDFFEKTEAVNYEFNDQYIILSEHSARVTLKVRKSYRAVAPFAHNVDNVVDEQITVTKNAAGAWRITNMRQLLPPRIY